MAHRRSGNAGLIFVSSSRISFMVSKSISAIWVKSEAASTFVFAAPNSARIEQKLAGHRHFTVELVSATGTV
ncbi:MAG: hypothetical protein R3E58_03045 [Phycisphaerae bacterium]